MSPNAAADAAAALQRRCRAPGAELLDYAADNWNDDMLALAILHNFPKWQDTIHHGDIYKALTQRCWRDRRTGVVYAYTFRCASVLAVFAAAAAGRPERLPDPALFDDLSRAETEFMGAHLSDQQTADGEPTWIVTELESLGFERINIDDTALSSTYHHHLFQAPVQCDRRLSCAMRVFAQVARSMREVSELEAAVGELAVVD